MIQEDLVNNRVWRKIGKLSVISQDSKLNFCKIALLQEHSELVYKINSSHFLHPSFLKWSSITFLEACSHPCCRLTRNSRPEPVDILDGNLFYIYLFCLVAMFLRRDVISFINNRRNVFASLKIIVYYNICLSFNIFLCFTNYILYIYHSHELSGIRPTILRTCTCTTYWYNNVVYQHLQ